MRIQRAFRIILATTLAVTTFGVYMVVTPSDVAFAAPNEINGTVFLDTDWDGQRGTGEPGVEGVTVTAFNTSGTQINSTLTQSDGTYTLLVPDGTEARVEFTDIPVGMRPGDVGTDSDTTIVFVTSPVDNVDMGLVRPEDFCQDDPYLASPCYFNGDPLLPGSAAGTSQVLRTFPYSASGVNPGLQNSLATGAEIGPTWGLAYQRSTQTLFAGALMKRHAGFGPLETGGIYAVQIDPDTGQAVSGPTPFLNLNTLGIPTGADPHSDLPAGGSTPSTDPNSWDAVGKISIGDMDMSGDDTRLWITNLFNQTLYSIDMASMTIVSSDWIVDAMRSVGNSNAASCAAGDVRPWAVDVHEGYLYVGVVCSAQSTQDVTALRAYILRRLDIRGTAPFELVYDFGLNYSRAHASSGAGISISARWRPWIGTMTSLCDFVDTATCNLAFNKQIIYPQPILSDIEFDDDDSIIVALMDRAGHQTGTANYATSNPWGPVDLYRDDTYAPFNTTYPVNSTFEGVAPGDILRICDVDGVYMLESDANCGGTTTGGASNGQGPDGGEYYYQENFRGIHTETVVGGLVLLPGSGEIGTSIFDPFEILSGGAAWFDNQTGVSNRRYEILPQDNSASTFGKAAGLGDIEAFCYQPPIEIGNRVWYDQNNDGVQDPGEPPLDSVTLELYQDNALIATAVTDANGNYIFSSGQGTSNTSFQYNLNLLPATAYEIRIPFAEGANQQPALAGLFLTGANTDPGVNGDSRDSDGQLVGVFAFVNLTTGAAGDNNHTYDFGFSDTPTTEPPDPPPGGGGGEGDGLGGVRRLPDTGFAPGKVSMLPDQRAEQAYANLGDLWLEIPNLGIKTSIVGVPRSDGTWDVDWLWDQAGWLEGSVFPTWQGNSVVTGHVYLPNGRSGPFVDLNKLRWGNQIIVHAFGQRYIYEVQSNHIVKPDDLSVLEHEEKPWLTLLTCKDYDESSDSYKYRIETRAVLMKIEPE